MTATAAVPPWLASLDWTGPYEVPNRLDATSLVHHLPDHGGCYVFTATDEAGPGGSPVPGQVLYVGKAKRLRPRVRGYLVDYYVNRHGKPRAPTTHKGRAFVYEYRDLRLADGRGLWLRWCHHEPPENVEGALIAALDPALNDRFETAYLDDDDDFERA